MKCLECFSTDGTYDGTWEEYWDGETEQAYYYHWWQCNACDHRVMSYDDEFIGEE